MAVLPLQSPGELQKLQQATGVQRIEIKTSARLNLKGRNGGLATALKRLKKDYGESSVTITISAPRGKTPKGDKDARKRLYADLMEIEDQLPSTARARVGLLFMDGDDFGRARVTELVEHHITAKRRVAAVDKDGNSIRILGAVEVILDEMEKQREALEACVTPGS